MRLFNYARKFIFLHNFLLYKTRASSLHVIIFFCFICLHWNCFDSWHKSKCVNFPLQINGIQQQQQHHQQQQSQTTICNLRRYHRRRRFQRNELLSPLVKSHRQRNNMWTRLLCRWQTKRHTLKVSDLYLYQSLFPHLSNRSVYDRVLQSAQEKKSRSFNSQNSSIDFLPFFSARHRDCCKNRCRNWFGTEA